MSSSIPPDYAEFLSAQGFVVIAGRDGSAQVWASLAAGAPGFARVLDDRRLLLAGAVAPADPLAGAFGAPGQPIGILAIDPDARRRIRLNGTGERTPRGLVVTVREAFSNCPKFIQRRVPSGQLLPPPEPQNRAGRTLGPSQIAMIRAADTFFIASSHPERGADASHRGGRPGFVGVSPKGDRLRFPDYPGNRMFQTLGNLTVDPRVGLLFVDWDSGAALQLTGRARIVWDQQETAAWPGAERLVEVGIDAVSEAAGALPVRWRLIEPFRRNPAVADA